MKTSVSLRAPRLVALLALAFASLSVSTLSAQTTVSTLPVGAITFSIPATPVQSVTANFSMPLISPAVYSGAVTAVGASTLTLAGTPFTDGGLTVAGAPFFVRIVSGSQAGRTILVTSNTSSVLTLDVTDNSTQTVNLNAAGFSVAIGDRIEVIPGDTIATFFGDGTTKPLLLTSNASAFSADTVSIFNKTTLRNEVFYHDTTKWRTTGVNSNRNNQILYPENAFSISRIAGQLELKFTDTGRVPELKPLVKFTASSTIFTSFQYPVDRTLAQLTFNNWVRSDSAFSADSISIFNATTGKYEVFYQRSTDTQWRKTSGATAVDQSNVIIPAGVAFRVTKSSGTFTDAGSYLSLNLPYSL